MIVLTGATGVVGSALLKRLLAEGEQVRVLVRDPRRLGPDRVRVQITLGDLSNPVALRQLVRGARAGRPPGRDHPRPARRQHRGAERPGDGPPAAPRRGGRRRAVPVLRRDGRDAQLAHALLPLEGAGRAGGDGLAAGRDRDVAVDRLRARRPWVTLLRRMSLLPVMPIIGSGARVLPADLGRGRRGLRPPGPARGRAGRRAAARAGRAGGAHLRGDRAARAVGLGPRPAGSCTSRCGWCGAACACSSGCSARPCSPPGRRRS